MFLLSLTATCQVCTVSLKAGQSTYNRLQVTGNSVRSCLAFSKPSFHSGTRIMPVKSIGSIGSLWVILSVEQPIPGIGVRLAPLSPVFRYPARGWPSQGDTISLLSASDAARDCARRP
jgi:hypothetical protein